MALTKEAPLGSYRVRAGLLLRKALLINGTLFNSEAWHGMTQQQVEDFEQIDEALLRGLQNGHSKIPIPALYLESSQTPIRYILACRRVLYLHTILHRSQTDLIRRVYTAQKADPVKGDFCQLVEGDLKLIGLDITEGEIEQMSRGQLKSKLKQQSKKAAFQYLLEMKDQKSKMDDIEYKTFQLQPYLTTPLFSADDASLLLALRTRTVRGVRSDFGNMYGSKVCPLPDCGEQDSLSHLQVCDVLRDLVPVDEGEPEYKDVFSMEISKQKEVVILYHRLLEAREQIQDAASEDED